MRGKDEMKEGRKGGRKEVRKEEENGARRKLIKNERILINKK